MAPEGPDAAFSPTPDSAAQIDWAVLPPDASVADVSHACRQAAAWGLAAVRVLPVYAVRAVRWLRKSPVRVAVPVGFPLGTSTAVSKVVETRQAVASGAHEIEMVMRLSAARSGEWHEVLREMRGVVGAAEGRPVTVILELGRLRGAEAERACALAVQAGAAFVGTGSGYGPAVDRPEEVARLCTWLAGSRVGVRATAGVTDWASVQPLLAAGAVRVTVHAGRAPEAT